ncbi:MAG: peptidylprolyl isomerase [Solirubrobacterales bacterium]
MVAALCLCVALALSACGSDSAGEASTPVSSASTCAKAEQPTAKSVNVSAPKQKLDASKTYTVLFKTNCGAFTITLDVKNNPKTAASFANLVKHGVYDGTWFHRIIAGFVVQGGDPKADGTGDAGYSVREKPTGSYRLGTVAMAKTANEPAGTSSSQFYIVIGDQGTSLPPDYAIAGEVSGGSDTIQAIAGLAGPPSDQSGTPTGVALVEKATLSAK